MDAIVRFSVHQRGLVVVCAVLFAAVGLYCAFELPVDAVPDITNRQVVINTVIPGLGPQDVERLVTFPLEVSLGGLPRVQQTRSISQYALSQVTVIFEDATDLYFARQLVSERLQTVGGLPPGVRPEMGPIATGLGEILHVGLQNDKLSLTERRTLMEWVVRPQLRTVPGLAEVNVWGGLEKQVQVIVDPQKLTALHLGLRDVVDAVSKNNANAGGAYVPRNSEWALVASTGILQEARDIGRIVLSARDGVPLTVSDVASVIEGAAPRQGAVTQDGRGEQVYALCLLLVGEDGRVVVGRVKERLAKIERTLPPGTRLVTFLDRSELIDRTVRTALRNLLEGGVLVILVLLFFLRHLRAGIIVSCAIPLAMLGAVVGMRIFSISANLMSLGAIDFGLIVDAAVIIVENCMRRLAEGFARRVRPLTEKERRDTIVEGTLEVLRASMFGELIIIAAYVPILTLMGVEGKMFRPMGLTVILALVTALILSLTLIPALTAQFLRVDGETRHPVLEGLKAGYERALGSVTDRPWRVVAPAVLLFMGCAAVFPLLGSEFIPTLDEGALMIDTRYPPGISLTASIERAGVLERTLRTNFPNEVDHVVSRIGRAEVATDPMPVSRADVIVSLKPPAWSGTRAQLVRRMEEALEPLPVGLGFGQPIKDRMTELLEGSGVRGDLSVKIFGPDRDVLAHLAAEAARLVPSVTGAGDVLVENTQGLSHLQVLIKRDQIARWGINVDDVNLMVSAVGGTPATTISDGARRFEVVVRVPDSMAGNERSIGRLPVATRSGMGVPLGQLAHLQTVEGPVEISRENGERRVAVAVNVRGRDLGSFVADLARRLDTEVKLPAGYRIEYGGTWVQLREARRRLMIAVPITFVMVFLLLLATFSSLRQALLVFTGIPFAVTGGVLALLLRGMPFSISAGIGFIALFGVAVLNGVVLVTFINHLRESGTPIRDAVLKGALTRLRPILMTAAVASIGFLPMATSTSAGAEVQKPLATVVIGGVVTSAVLTLFVLPALYGRVESRRQI